MDRPPHLDIDLNEPPPPSPPHEFAAPVAPPPPPLPPANVQAHLLLPHHARELALAYHRAESWRLAAATASAPATAGSSLEVPPPPVLQSPAFAPPPLRPPVLRSPAFAPPPLPPPVLQSPTFAPLLPPPPRPPQLPPPANVQTQLLLVHQAGDIPLAYHREELWWRSAIAAATAGSSAEGLPPAPVQHPGVAGWGGNQCASCGLSELPGSTVICDACERGFHQACVHVARRPPVGVNEGWMCPECATGPVPLDITRQLCQLPLDNFLMVLHLFLFSEFYT
ncbi:WAS/WASL-interacting protein family member 3-like [Triticum dicoccoides]|uniref:WAS/WASL-interacting protein family member 3-like n=1 Tax=Triticum dicoccoides TaxID=85692 RepID=UPI00188EA385|nr:WAS/WASL-interacting protein family member 3-like [Triticum dicoccoides]